ncbi:MAG: glycosyltransferase [Thermomicrobiales bacterium]|nr:MAG: glycosyltransferase [Thermomicrobiales bacterium]
MGQGQAAQKILMACANYWTTPFQVGSHHLARGFVDAGCTVGFVSDPISPFHLLGHARKELASKFRLYRTGGMWDLDHKLWAYVPAALVTPRNMPLLRSHALERDWAGLTWPSVEKVVCHHGFDRVDLLYCDSPKHLSWLSRVTRTRTVFRVADNTSGFGRTTPAARAAERDLAAAADLVVYSAETLKDYVESLNPRRMAHLPNGVNFSHFAKPDVPVPSEYASIRRPIAVYAGYMDVWFDYALLNRLVAALPNVSFVLIGGSPPAHAKCAPAANLHLLGPRPFARLPEYLRAANVGLIPFDVQNHPTLVHSIHPLKLYEYLAAGLPVVATRWRELERLQSPARLCESAEEFSLAIELSVAEPPRRAEYERYAQQADWKYRVLRLLDLAFSQ